MLDSIVVGMSEEEDNDVFVNSIPRKKKDKSKLGDDILILEEKVCKAKVIYRTIKNIKKTHEDIFKKLEKEQKEIEEKETETETMGNVESTSTKKVRKNKKVPQQSELEEIPASSSNFKPKKKRKRKEVDVENEPVNQRIATTPSKSRKISLPSSPKGYITHYLSPVKQKSINSQIKVENPTPFTNGSSKVLEIDSDDGDITILEEKTTQNVKSLQNCVSNTTVSTSESVENEIIKIDKKSNRNSVSSSSSTLSYSSSEYNATLQQQAEPSTSTYNFSVVDTKKKEHKEKKKHKKIPGFDVETPSFSNEPNLNPNQYSERTSATTNIFLLDNENGHKEKKKHKEKPNSGFRTPSCRESFDLNQKQYSEPSTSTATTFIIDNENRTITQEHKKKRKLEFSTPSTSGESNLKYNAKVGKTKKLENENKTSSSQLEELQSSETIKQLVKEAALAHAISDSTILSMSSPPNKTNSDRKRKNPPSTSKSTKRSPKIKLKNDDEQAIDEVIDNEKVLTGALQGSEATCVILKRIIREEFENQKEHLRKAIEENDNIESLLTDDDYRYKDLFFSLDSKSQMFYTRMLLRRHGWHRVQSLEYKDISDDLVQQVMKLEDVNFLTTDLSSESLDVSLDLLKVGEMQQLCKKLNISDAKTKVCLKNKILNSVKHQRSIKDMFSNEKSSREDLVKEKIEGIVGQCMKLKDDVRHFFKKVVVLFSLTHDVTEEKTRLNQQCLMLSEVLQGSAKFPDYKLSKCIIFRKYNDFMRYFEALNLYCKFENAITNNNYEEAHSVALVASKELNELLKDKEYRIRCSQMLSYLKKFTAGNLYASILTQYCQKWKSKSDDNENITFLELLFNQQIFGNHSRGKWYDLLLTLHLNTKNEESTNKAAQLIIVSMKDEFLDDVIRLSLQMRAKQLFNRKTNTVKDQDLFVKLGEIATISVSEPCSTEIKGSALSNDGGGKLVYSRKTMSGQEYSTVEEQAIDHYKQNGYSYGVHNEGLLIKTIYGLLFWDIIYGISPIGVFQTPYQDRPLDLSSKYFYRNRKEQLDKRIEELKSWTDVELQNHIDDVIKKNEDCHSSLVNWNSFSSNEIIHGLILCMGRQLLVAICERFIHELAVCRAGFPDLTLWNVQTKRVKFVEVKSPKDKLSAKQRLWLDYLRKNGGDCEVCNVIHVGAKKLQ